MKILIPALSVVFLSSAAFAADTGSSTNAPPECPKGQVWDSSQKKCVEKKSGVSDKDLIATGRALAKSERYYEALEVLGLVQNKDPVALTYIGYSLRKSGQTEEAIGFYHQALAIDPSNADTREYLGEGYVASGKLDLAKAELKKIGEICGTKCEQYALLESAIASAVN
ncbi:tetratricopeptide repeat protein [Terrihabitans soli]|nr:tetratricopeptide repeat protein [Terrihabitans soli]